MFNLDSTLSRMNKIQSDIYDGIVKVDDDDVLDEFYKLARTVRKNGYSLKKDRGIGYCKWYVVKSRKRNIDDTCWVKYAPPCDYNNQCTTRALFYCLEEKIPYDTIRNLQNRVARDIYTYHYDSHPKSTCFGWNNESVWGEVASRYGYRKIRLGRKCTRQDIAIILKECGRILTHSSHHLAAIHNGKIYDSWNSSRCEVDFILVKSDIVEEVRQILYKHHL